MVELPVERGVWRCVWLVGRVFEEENDAVDGL